jgi:hypothetical protein
MKVPFLKVYTGYVNNYDQALATLEQCKKNPQFEEFLNHTKNLPNVDHDLPSYLIMPIQRIPRYDHSFLSFFLFIDSFKHIQSNSKEYDLKDV